MFRQMGEVSTLKRYVYQKDGPPNRGQRLSIVVIQYRRNLNAGILGPLM